jgi:hypothetical protein
MNWLKQIFTESDNQTQDAFRWMAVLSIITGLGLMIYAVVWRGQVFDMTQFGTGVGVLLVGAGAALKLKPEMPNGTSTTTATSTQTTSTVKE